MSTKPGSDGLRLLSLDGGGISVLSALKVVDESMNRLKSANNLSEAPRPCDVFEFMTGTGMGACISRDPTGSTETRFYDSGNVVQGDHASALEKVVGEIVARHCRRADAKMMDASTDTNTCKVMVCASTAHALRAGIPTCIRTYPVSANQGPDCTIVEAVRATTATPGMFKRAIIEENGIAIPYVGGGLECNNPTDIALREVSSVFPDRPIACVMSVGAGQLHSASIPDARIYDGLLPSKLLPAIQRIASDCERTHQDLARRFEHTSGVYFRFSTDQGMQDVDQYNATRLPEVQVHARQYLQDASVNTRMQDAVKAIAARMGAVKVSQGNIQTFNRSSSRIGRCPPPSHTFTGREDILERMRGYFFDASPTERRLFVLCGLGGAGKTQLALKFVDMHKNLFWDVFYIDATSDQTASAGLSALAKAANAGTTQEEALAWLESKQERWLLVLNNADDPKLNLQQYFPKSTHGDILITTRNQEMRTHTRGTGHFCRVGGMLPEDALELMLKVSPAEGEQDAVIVANTLAEQFGYFALAIVQAGAYMHTTECGLSEYLKIFQKARAEVLRRGLIQKQDDHELSLFTSWEVSYRQLSARATQLLHIISFFHHEGVAEAIFEAASTEALSYEVEIPLNESQVTTQTIIFSFLASLRTPSDEWDPLTLKDLTRELRAFSLLDYDTHSCSYSMHPLVQEWSRTTAPDATAMRECAAWVLALCVHFGKQSSEDFAFRRRLLPHLLALDSDHTQMVPELANYLQLVYLEAGYEKEYGALIAIALQASRDMLGNEHPTTLTCMQALALAFWGQGRLEEAETLQTEVIELNKRVLGHEHPDTLTSMHNLAVTYRDQEWWREAEGLFLEVIEARKRVIGAEHRNTLLSVGMLASTYSRQGRLSEAESLYVEVLETTKRVMGGEHPDTLVAMHNLATTFGKQGKLREAESLMEETVALRKQVLGESHARTQGSARYLEFVQRRMRSEPSSAGDP
ncbi:FabD/lysophospholipase-like protein [Ceratobasidium sp. AG-I]|nr:FabD/lysophospholipase-like protein [Ceratobasidium sp. AG-I]